MFGIVWKINLVLFEKHEIDSNAQSSIPLCDTRSLHIIKVLHKKTGDVFDAGVICGRRGTAKIINIDTKRLSLSFNLFEEAPPRLPVEIGVGFPRPIQLRRILRELSSVGIAKISLFGTDLGEKSYHNTNLLKDGGARAALIEGAAQSRDTLLPEITVFDNVDAWVHSSCFTGDAASDGVVVRIIADNNKANVKTFFCLPKSAAYIIAIGSERGWSERERAFFCKKGFSVLSFGERALRTESAALCAAVIAGLSFRVSSNSYSFLSM